MGSPSTFVHFVELTSTAVQLVLLLTAAWADLSTRLIPDFACLGVGLAGAAVRLTHGPLALVESIGTAALLFVALLLPHAKRVFGGGDVKLLAAVALGQSFSGAMRVIYVTALAGGVLSLGVLALRRLPRPRPAPTGATALRRVLAAERWRIRRHAPLPYGMAIACGGLWAVLLNQGH
jgi:prepilin peptidase CpaA